MAADSSELGFIAPSSSDVYDRDLDRILQAAVVGITGIAGNLVRPRWQADMPNMPEHDVNWCALGLTSGDADPYVYKRHDNDAYAGRGGLVVERDEELIVLHSFYGPSSRANCETFRDGLSVDQNRDTLRASGIVLQSVGSAVPVPTLMAQKWIRRVDVSVTYRRRTERTYPINHIVAADLLLDNEHFTTAISVTNP